jgi:hypothetical protein
MFVTAATTALQKVFVIYNVSSGALIFTLGTLRVSCLLLIRNTLQGCIQKFPD